MTHQRFETKEIQRELLIHTLIVRDGRAVFQAETYSVTDFNDVESATLAGELLRKYVSTIDVEIVPTYETVKNGDFGVIVRRRKGVPRPGMWYVAAPFYV